jgi:threonine aldolase
MFCLSKGLCAPAGSLLCGSKAFILKALRIRKMLGGGMRQVGILAAAGIIALENMTSRLIGDHIKAQKLAQGLRQNCGLQVNEPMTNMVFLTLTDSLLAPLDQVINALQQREILVGAVGPRSLRLVTHYWISENDISETIAAFDEILSQ